MKMNNSSNDKDDDDDVKSELFRAFSRFYLETRKKKQIK
jgi:hypothetical protein